MVKPLYHAPADCPVCGDELIVTRKGCLTCGTELAGEFASCSFCSLDQADHELLKVFLGSRGNLREVEKHLQVSYPTARARLDAVLAKLGYLPASGDDDAGPSEDDPAPTGDVSASPREQILARVAKGELAPDVAARLIASL